MTAQIPIRVVIVDGHERVRQALTTALMVVDDVSIVGVATGGAEALMLSARLQPDVVLMEIVLPDSDGVNTIQQLRRQVPKAKVVVLTTDLSADLRQRAVAAGAAGYLSKYVAVHDLLAAIRAASGKREEGEDVLS